MLRFKQFRRGDRHRIHLCVERLEDRTVPAIAITLTGTQVAFLGDEFGYNVELSVDESGRLQHNVADENLNSFVDLDASQAGDQTLLASQATLLAIDLVAAGGSGSITGIDNGHISFASGGLLRFDWQASSAASLTIFSANDFTRIAGSSSLSVSLLGPNDNELALVYGDGADTVLAGGFNARPVNVTTNGGDDFVFGTNLGDFISTGAGNDVLVGLGGDDFLAADEQFASAGNDVIFAGSGDDFLVGGWGNDQLYGGSGFDSASEDLVTGTFIVTPRRLNVDGFIVRDHEIESFFVNGSQGDDLIDVAQADGSCTLAGLGGNDTIIGSDFADSISGDDGNDTIRGRDGDDLIDSGLGDDLIQAGNGNDSVFGGADNDDLSGGAGQDVLRGGDGNDRLEGNIGNDDLDGEAGSDIVFGGAGNDTLIEHPDPTELGDALHGGDGDDYLQIFGGVNTLYGDAGNDSIYAGDFGIDDIWGGSGNDMIQASLSDTFSGGAGVDSLTLTTGLRTARITNTNITLDGVTRARAGIENFAIFAIDSAFFDASGYTAGFVTFTGSQADDVLIGSENGDTLVGGTGRDSLYGRGGNDVFRADIYDATVLGGGGIDGFGFYYFDDPTSLSRTQILDLLFSLGIVHDIANNEPLSALIS